MDINIILKKFMLENKDYLAAYSVFMFVYPASSVYLPKFYGKIAEDFKSGAKPQFEKTLAAIVVANLIFFILDKMDSKFIPKLQAYVRVNIVKAVIEAYKNKFQEQELGQLIGLVVKLPLIVRDLVTQIRNHMIPMFLILTMTVVRFSMIDKRLGLFVLSGILGMVATFLPLFKKCFHQSATMAISLDEIHEEISEIFDNLIDIYSMGTMAKEVEWIEEKQALAIDIFTETFRTVNNYRIGFTSMGTAIFLGTIGYAYTLFKKERVMDVSTLISVTMTCMFIINKIGGISSEMPDFVVNLGTYNRIRNYMLNIGKSEIPNTVSESSLSVEKGDIKFENVGINYGDKVVLKDFNQHIKAGESVAITGGIGKGKSSLIKALLRMKPITSGRITIDNVDISTLTPENVRSQIIYVRQNPIPYNRTLYENIIYGNDSVSREEVERILKYYNLTKFFSVGLDDKLGRKGERISGGQRQMIFLIRVLLSDRKIVVFDEPTSSLDSTSAHYVMTLLKDIIKGRTVILITHDKELTSMVNRTIKL